MKNLLIVVLLMLVSLFLYVEVLQPIQNNQQHFQHEIEHYTNGILA